MVKGRKFYKEFFAMMIVLVLQNVVTLSVNLADNIMLGAYAEVSLAGVSTVNQVQFVYQQMLFALGEGAVILGTQYFGRGDAASIRKVASISMHFGIGLSLILFTLTGLFPAWILGLFTTDEAIIAEGCRYLRVVRYTYLFFAVTQILLATLRSTGIVRISLGLSVWALLINCSINYTLIYGHFHAPRMGVTGAAIGTLTARITELLILCIYIARKEKNLHLNIRHYFTTDRLLRKDYVKVTLPVFAASSMWGINTAMQNAILGHMTSRAIAANSVASNLFLMVKSMAIGTASTASFFIGRTIGEGDEKKLRDYARTMQVLFVFVGILSAIILFFIRIPILSLYKLEPETMQMANTFLLILCVVILGMSYQMPTNIGIIRGGGDTRYVMSLDFVSIWVLVIPISMLMAFVVKASPIVIVWCLNSDQLFKCIPAFWKCNFGHWAHKLTR